MWASTIREPVRSSAVTVVPMPARSGCWPRPAPAGRCWSGAAARPAGSAPRCCPGPRRPGPPARRPRASWPRRRPRARPSRRPRRAGGARRSRSPRSWCGRARRRCGPRSAARWTLGPQLQDGPADADGHPDLQRDRSLDLLLAHVGAVGRAEVLEHPLPVVRLMRACRPEANSSSITSVQSAARPMVMGDVPEGDGRALQRALGDDELARQRRAGAARGGAAAGRRGSPRGRRRGAAGGGLGGRGAAGARRRGCRTGRRAARRRPRARTATAARAGRAAAP